MSIFKWLFGNKKHEADDGQEEYFKEDFAPIVKHESKNNEPKPIEPAKSSYESPRAIVRAEKRAARKVERNIVKPTPRSERIIRPSAEESVIKPSKPESVKTVTKADAVKPAKVKTAKPVKVKDEKAVKAKVYKKPIEIKDDTLEVNGASSVTEGKTMPNGKFEIEKAKDGRYFFTLYASNHTAIAYSQLYSSTSGVNTGISSIIANSQKADIEDTTLKNPTSLPCPKWEIYIDKAKQYRFRLYAPNGQCICHSSHGYSTKTGCKGGMDSIKRFAAEAKVNKTYLK